MSPATIPATSRAVVVEAFGSPVQVKDVPIPDALEPGALLVRVEACSVCGTDLHLWQGELSLGVDLPVILGHEMVGRIVQVGAGAERDSLNQELSVGDRIIWTHTACGSCKFCLLGQVTLCVNRLGYMFQTCAEPPYLLGGFSEYVYVLPDSGRVRVPDQVSSDLASIASCALRSVMKAFREVGSLSSSEHVLIQGSGPLGLLATAVSVAAGVRSVTVIGGPSDRLELAKRFGATNVLDVTATSTAERAERIAGWTEGYGPDVTFEFSGNPNAFAEGLALTSKGGRYMVVGQLGKGEVAVAPSMITAKNLAVMGSFSGGVRDYWDALRFFERFQDDFPFTDLITNTYTLETVNDALTSMKAEREIKPLITF
ncbi:zinc-binding dehydrogenase [Aeromicrobium sp. CTD01-1L150]|uniref:zinc-binding dehydrogenase n=1 Tax=Aeromicrobium sp. CTD01-1L150 TaxID=3341830 RepID=UPI0035BF5288